MDRATPDDIDSGQGTIPDIKRLSGILTAREAAELLGVNERTVRRAITRSEIQAVKAGRAFQITPAALASYQERLRRPRAVDPLATVESERTQQRSLLRLVDPVRGPAFTIPRPLTSFCGREREVAAIAALLTQPDLRLLTLTGPGGIGKTRLALHAAEELVPHYADGVAFVPLAPVADAKLVPAAIAVVLGVREHGSRPITEQLLAAMRDREFLLILDNFEHVLPAATFVVDLLSACPRLTILVTSRMILRVSGEQRFPVPPMSLPAPETTAVASRVKHIDAVQLFLARAQAAQPAFALTDGNASDVVDICRRLDGLPLAIELAAARTAVLPPVALLTRLEQRLAILTGGPRDAPRRLRTMRDAIAWSHDLLSIEEQVLFRRLAVFVGGCTLEAAASVAGAGNVLDGIDSLVSGSLLHLEDDLRGEPRYVMLETIREFALEQLTRAGDEDETRQRHAAYWVAFVEQGYPNHFGPATGIDRRLQQLEKELPNLRAALAFMAEAGNADGVLRLAGALAVFCQLRSHLHEGRQWLEWALAHTVEVQTDARCRALVGFGLIRWAQGEYEQAAPLVHAALAIADQIGDTEIVAHAIHVLGLIEERQQRWEQAELLLEQALGLWRALGAQDVEAMALQLLSGVAYGLGERDVSADRAKEALTLFRSIGHASGAAMALCRLARLARDRGEDRGAASAYHEALQLWVGIGDRWFVVHALAGRAELASAHGDLASAAALLGVIDALAEEVGAPIFYSARINAARSATIVGAALGAQRFTELHAAGRQLPLAEAVAVAATIAGMIGTTDGLLTARELDVLRLIAQTRTDQEIADTLFLSRRTVNVHAAHILAKLNVRSRQEAAIRARELGLLPGIDESFPHT